MSTRQMRICVTMAGCSRLQGGLFHSVRQLWLGVHRLGHQVEVKAVEDAYSEEDCSQYAPLNVKLTRCIGPQRLSYSPQLVEYLQAQGGQHDVLSSHGLWSYADYAAWKASKFLNIPHIIHPHGMVDGWALKNSSLKKRVSRWVFQGNALRSSACLRALTTAEADSLRRFGCKGPIAVLPNGIAIDSLQNATCEKTRQSIQALTNGQPYVIFLSRIHPKKNLKALLAAWKLLRSTVKNELLVLAGPDELGHGNELREFIQQHDLQNVLFTGPLYGAAKAEWLRQCKLLVLPSLSEGFPVVLLEAAAMKKPVLMTPACYYPQLAEAGGAVISGTSPMELADALTQLMKLPSSDLKRMGECGYKLVAKEHTWESISGKMAELCQALIEKRELPGFVETVKN
ncbi:MAG: glycosyltransferase [Sumerlaeia bacterium]